MICSGEPDVRAPPWAKVPGLAVDEVGIEPGGHLKAPAALLRVGDLDLDMLFRPGCVCRAVGKKDLDAAGSGIQNTGVARVAGQGRIARSAGKPGVWPGAVCDGDHRRRDQK